MEASRAENLTQKVCLEASGPIGGDVKPPKLVASPAMSWPLPAQRTQESWSLPSPKTAPPQGVLTVRGAQVVVSASLSWLCKRVCGAGQTRSQLVSEAVAGGGTVRRGRRGGVSIAPQSSAPPILPCTPPQRCPPLLTAAPHSGAPHSPPTALVTIPTAQESFHFVYYLYAGGALWWGRQGGKAHGHMDGWVEHKREVRDTGWMDK